MVAWPSRGLGLLVYLNVVDGVLRDLTASRRDVHVFQVTRRYHLKVRNKSIWVMMRDKFKD